MMGATKSQSKSAERRLWSHAVWGRSACCFNCYKQEGFNLFTLSSMNTDLQQCSEEFQLTLDRKLLKVTLFQTGKEEHKRLSDIP